MPPLIKDTSPKFLMDQEEGNLGNEATVQPLPPPTVGPGVPKRIIDFNGNSKYGSIMTIGIAAFSTSTMKNPDGSTTPTFGFGIGGPIVAIVEFGNGGVFSTVEVSVPVGPATDVTLPRTPNLQNAVMLTVPASNVRVIARNDGSLIP